MNKSRKEYPILKKISNFCPPYLPRILRHYNSSSNRKRRRKRSIGSSEIKIQGETNTRRKEVHFLRVNATKYIYIYTRGGQILSLYRVIGQQREFIFTSPDFHW